jgi:D-serine deaminase-like pyridoxal phosphate-dependent protein
MQEDGRARYERYRALVAEQPLPCALVDLDALDHNVDTLARVVRGSGKTLRIATKSLRCPDLVRRVRERAADVVRGLMTYTAAETAFWAERGERDLLLAYPTARPEEAAAIARANASGAVAAVVVDALEHLEVLEQAAKARGTSVPVVVDVDMAWRPLGSATHLGVRRSPLREAADVVTLAERITKAEGLRFHGVMGYEAQVAGVPDAWPAGSKGSGLVRPSVAVRTMKRASTADVVARRKAVLLALTEAGMRPAMFNGGGTGSVLSSTRDASLTEVTAGSGFLDSHLFDGYAGLDLVPAAFFALQVVRRPGDGMVTCHGGGYVASGSAGRDRLPVPALPEGLRLLSLEGAGEVQTPLELPDGVALRPGEPVFFRHAKTGELAEHFTRYLLVRGAHLEESALTYRGLGQCFLG